MSQIIDHATSIHAFLEGAGIEHLLLGNDRINATGHKRFSDDLDFVVAKSNQLSAKNCFLEHGFKVLNEGPDVCQFEGPISVDLVYAQDTLFTEMFLNADRLDKTDIRYVGVEGVIALKVQAYSENPAAEAKELQDITNLVEESGDVDWQAVKHFTDLFKQWPRIESIKGVATKVSE